jgi:hypothetical protein
LTLISRRHIAGGDRLDQHNIVAHTDPKRTGNVGAIDEIPHDSDQSWQEKASDALGLDGKKTPFYTP